MASQRDDIKASVSRRKQFQKRTAPDEQEPSRAEVEQQKLIEAQKYGKTRGIRLYESTWQAVEKAANEHGIRKRQLHEFLLLAGLQMLSMGRIELPIKPREGESAVYVDLPDPPEQYR